MAGTIKFGMALVLVCAVVSTVYCRPLNSPNIDQFSAGETDSQRVRRNSPDGPGMKPNSSFPNSSLTLQKAMSRTESNEGPGKVLCNEVLVKKNNRTQCKNASIEVQWSPVENGARIWVYDLRVDEVRS